MALRVLLSLPDALGKPGIGATALHQARGLVDQGVDLTVCCTSVAATVRGAECRATLAPAGRRIPHRALGVSRAHDLHDRRVARLIGGRAGRFDVVHCWPRGGARALAAAHAAGAVALREAPNTHTAHAWEVAAAEAAAVGLELPAGHSHAPDRRRLAREQAEYQAAHAILVPSPHVAATFAARGFSPERLLQHRYGCDLDRFVPAPRSPAGGRERGLTALFLGRCEPRKGLHHALRAWHGAQMRPGGRLIVTGTFVPGYLKALGGLLEQPGVEVRPFAEDVPSLLRQADVLLLPSVEEGSALVTYEAQAAGVVPLVSDAAGALCEHGRHGLIHPAGDVAALTSHLRWLDKDRALLERLRAEALTRRDDLSWTAAARALVGCYQAALERFSPRFPQPAPQGPALAVLRRAPDSL